MIKINSFAIKIREGLEILEELTSLQNQVKSQDKPGKQNFHENIRKVLETFTDTIKNTAENWRKTLISTSKKNNKALENLNNKILEIMNDRGTIASYLMSPLSETTDPENTSQFKLVKDHNSNRVNDLLLYNSTPITLYDNLLTFCDTGKEFELKGLVF